MTTQPVLYLMVGLPGAGKTTRARELEAKHGALRLTPDEWMIPLFGESGAGGKRDVLEGRLVWVASRVLSSGGSVILDFGLWGRDERSALRWLASSMGTRCVTEYLPVDPEAQYQRIRSRFIEAPEQTFALTEAMLNHYAGQFEAPDDAELLGTFICSPPTGYRSWSGWMAERWPSYSGA